MKVAYSDEKRILITGTKNQSQHFKNLKRNKRITFYQGFLSRTTHRTAGEKRKPLLEQKSRVNISVLNKEKTENDKT